MIASMAVQPVLTCTVVRISSYDRVLEALDSDLEVSRSGGKLLRHLLMHIAVDPECSPLAERLNQCRFHVCYWLAHV